jgi:hypothetical protein
MFGSISNQMQSISVSMRTARVDSSCHGIHVVQT